MIAVYGLKLEIGNQKLGRDDPSFASGYAGQDPGATVNRELWTVKGMKTKFPISIF